MPSLLKMSNLLRLLMILLFLLVKSDFAVAAPKPVESTHEKQSVNFIRDVLYKVSDGSYQMVVEIPAGTNQKWQTNKTTGELYHEVKNGQSRIVKFLPYPGNYGFIPQTHFDKTKGGDGDPLDIIVLSAGTSRGSILTIKVLGALKFHDKGEADHKLIAVEKDGLFSEANSLSELMVLKPGTVEIVKTWFESYKKPGKMVFMGYADTPEAIKTIEETHQYWLESEETENNTKADCQ